MPRVQDIKNQWGVSGGPNPQRSDLWQVDLEPAISGINRADAYHPQIQVLPRYVPSAIVLPELRIKAEPVRRDSRSYNMPSWDDPLDPVKISFVMDDGTTLGRSLDSETIGQSEVYRMLDVWRRLTRAGRGSLGTELPLVLDENYQIVFRFPIYAYLCRGYAVPPISMSLTTESRFFRPRTATQNATFDVPLDLAPSAVQTRVLQDREAAFKRQMTAGLEVTNVLMLENAWLGGFRVSDMTYDAAKVVTIDATFYAENIYQFPEASNPPVTL